MSNLAHPKSYISDAYFPQQGVHPRSPSLMFTHAMVRAPSGLQVRLRREWNRKALAAWRIYKKHVPYRSRCTKQQFMLRTRIECPKRIRSNGLMVGVIKHRVRYMKAFEARHRKYLDTQQSLKGLII